MFDGIKNKLISTLGHFSGDEKNVPPSFEFLRCHGSADKRATLNIYVHGYSAVMTPLDKTELKRHVGTKVASNSRNFVFIWSSGSLLKHVSNPGRISDIGKILKSPTTSEKVFFGMKGITEVFDHFKVQEEKAEYFGEHILLQEIKKHFELDDFPNIDINLIGHSLGARMVLVALTKNKDLAQKLKIKNVVLLAGASSKDIDWWQVSSAINGDIFNCYNPRDFVLMAKPDTERCIGRHPIKGSQIPEHRVKNIEMKIQHWAYWRNLEELMKKIDIL